ncbi:trypsin isoform X2 [Zeugodacus cucurbitae]|uniref:trypsin isoform X2 n=1 Tax=Zeugodacus cucurbitae TaxID=28588 RepID=UPI0023D91E92|nr:trypsin isoform X2 [Zeugodacus cucurbitae]XP_054086617.1 trypsin isoform X2 [Zeugodacus cucurbitae]XP_054086618.1 trypsin isoform X2 [Zeugodacus cucurbitae]
MWQAIWRLFQILLLAHTSYANSKNLLTVYDVKQFGASPVAITSAPWQVSVRLQAYEGIQLGEGHWCGGAVITTRVVLTAAHCLIYPNKTQPIYRVPSDFIIYMGSVHLHEVTPYTLHYNVQELVPHPDFSLTPLQNDLGLLFIAGMVPANYPTAAPLALQQLALKPGLNCSVTGWGITGKRINWPILLSATIPIVDLQQCNNSFHGGITQGMLCAGGNLTNNDTIAFLGDSGGPLVCNGKLSGVLSWDSGYPGVYTNVSAYYNWILATNTTFNYARYGGAMGLKLAPQQIVLGIFCLLTALLWSQAVYAK